MKKKKKSEYFGKDVEDAIIRHNQSDNPTEKERLFTYIIYPALNELVQNLLFAASRRGNPYRTEISYDDLQHEAVCFLYEKLGSFDPERGAKAFSFFNRVAMNYLLANSQKVYKEMLRRCDVDLIDMERNLDQEMILESSNSELRDFVKVWAKNCNDRLEILFPKENEQKVANAVFDLFEDLELIDIYDKKVLYHLIRERVDVKTHHITTVMAEVKRLFNHNYKYHLNQYEE